MAQAKADNNRNTEVGAVDRSMRKRTVRDCGRNEVHADVFEKVRKLWLIQREGDHFFPSPAQHDPFGRMASKKFRGEPRPGKQALRVEGDRDCDGIRRGPERKDVLIGQSKHELGTVRCNQAGRSAAGASHMDESGPFVVAAGKPVVVRNNPTAAVGCGTDTRHLDAHMVWDIVPSQSPINLGTTLVRILGTTALPRTPSEALIETTQRFR